MVKTIIFIGLLSLVVSFNSNAHDSDELDELEKEMQEIKHRLSELESLLNNPRNAPKAVISAEGWKSVSNWRKLTTDMSYDEVRKILGEPHRIDGGSVARWYYQNGSNAVFIGNQLHSWKEPRQ